jgi:hypothetical protein
MELVGVVDWELMGILTSERELTDDDAERWLSLLDRRKKAHRVGVQQEPAEKTEKSAKSFKTPATVPTDESGDNSDEADDDDKVVVAAAPETVAPEGKDPGQLPDVAKKADENITPPPPPANLAVEDVIKVVAAAKAAEGTATMPAEIVEEEGEPPEEGDLQDTLSQQGALQIAESAGGSPVRDDEAGTPPPKRRSKGKHAKRRRGSPAKKSSDETPVTPKPPALKRARLHVESSASSQSSPLVSTAVSTPVSVTVSISNAPPAATLPPPAINEIVKEVLLAGEARFVSVGQEPRRSRSRKLAEGEEPDVSKSSKTGF